MADIEDFVHTSGENLRKGRVADQQKASDNKTTTQEAAAAAAATTTQEQKQEQEQEQESSVTATGGVQSNIRNVVPRSGADIPGDATVYIHTFGCGHNVSDGEYMAGQLHNDGYRLTDEFSAADCYLINSCTVKNPSEDHFVTLVRRAKQTNKPVIVAGCVPAGDPSGSEWKDVSVLGVRQIHRVSDVVQEALRGNTVRYFDTAEALAASGRGAAAAVSKSALKKQQKKLLHQQQQQKENKNENNEQEEDKEEENDNNDNATTTSTTSTSNTSNTKKINHITKEQVPENSTSLPSLLLPKVRRNKYIEIIPINVGCLNTCTYCKTKHARGDLQSWPVEEIVQRVKDSVKEGVHEIYLTSEDTGAYGIDIGTDIVQLMRAILKVLEPTDVMCRLGMTNPPYFIRHLDTIGPLFRHKNFYEFAHIPVQSGSDSVLDMMKREYSVDEFKLCVNKLREHAPGITIATDIICAFPFEGEEEWKDTMKLCREIQFPVLNISRFYPRRGTPAAAMKQIPTDVAKKRTQELSQLFNEATPLCETELKDTRWNVWLTEVAHDKHNLVGHTKNFVQVLVDPTEAGLGDYVEIQVTDVLRFCVKAKVLKVVKKDDTASSHNHGNTPTSSSSNNNNKSSSSSAAAAAASTSASSASKENDVNSNACCGSGICCDKNSSSETKEKLQESNEIEIQQEEKKKTDSSTSSSSSSIPLVLTISAIAAVATGIFIYWKKSKNQK